MQRTVIVSGGGTGIGRATACRFARAGDRVIIIGRRENVLVAAAAALNVEALVADLSQPSDVERLAAAMPSDIDVVVNNAGGAGAATGADLAGVAADWEGELRRNVLPGVLLTEALESRLRRPGASVVNVSSIAALAGGGDSYSGAKAAVLGWTLDLAVRWGECGIRVNAVVPGYIEDTEFFGDRMTDDRRRRLIDRTLLGRAGTPDDVASCIHFLASDDASYVTGQLLQVNGGALLGR
jgi:3-oxoacyl-[acyl-carrier protein] reductase